MVVAAAQAFTLSLHDALPIFWLQLLWLPHSSVAVQVRLVAYLFLAQALPQLPPIDVSVRVSVTVPQASVGTGSTNSGEAGHSMVVAAAQAITGGVLSSTVMVW